jgi:hypothetical protein
MIRSILLLFAFFVYSTIGHCPEIVDGGCSLCSEGECFSNPDDIFTSPDHPPVPCSQIQTAAFNGEISTERCELFASQVDDSGCTCHKGGHAPHPPVTPAPVTPAPTLAPTPAPTKAKKKKGKNNKKKGGMIRE